MAGVKRVIGIVKPEKQTYTSAFISNGEEKETNPLIDASYVDVTQLYLTEIGFKPLLTREDEYSLAKAAKKGDAKAREKIINGNLRLVVKIARTYIHRGLLLSDLIEEGNIGLMHAVEKFDPELGYRFSTYATWWIKQSIERAIMNQSRTVRLPVHVLKRITKCLNAIQKLAGKDHMPSLHEIAEALHESAEEVGELLQYTESNLSMETPISEYNQPLQDAIPDNTAINPEYIFQEESFHQHVIAWLDNLPDPQREVVIRRFGLLGREPETLEQIGDSIGFTRERVRQVQLEALKSLKAMIDDEGLDEDTLFS